METRNVLNSLGQVVGQVSLPDGTPEETWTKVLASYSIPNISSQEIVARKIEEAMKFGNEIIIEAATENVLMGITQLGKTKAVADYCFSIQTYLQSGSLYAALEEINAKIAAGIPVDLSPFVTEARMNQVKDKIMGFLGI